MAQDILVTRIRTEKGDLPIDYNALANKPTTDDTLTHSGSFADAKAVGDKIKAVSETVSQLSEDVAAEKARAEGVEGDLNTRLASVESAIGESGSIAGDIANALTEAKGYVDTEVKALADGAVATNTSDISALTESLSEQVANLQAQIDGKANSEHTHGYLPLSGGTLTGVTTAASTAVGTKGIRNITASTSACGSTLATGEIYIQYE